MKKSYHAQKALSFLRWFLFGGLATCSLGARADGLVRSEFVMQLDDAIFKAPEFEFASLLRGTESFSLPDSTVPGELPVNVGGITGAVSYQLESAVNSVVLGADIPLQSKRLAVALKIARLSVDTVVTKQIGDTRINVRVQGQCENIPITLAENAQGKATANATVAGAIRTTIDAQGLPLILMPWVIAQWSEGAWTVGAFSCSRGGTSFAEQVSGGLKDYFAQASTQDNVSEELRRLVNERLQNYQAQVRKWFLQPRTVATGVNGLSLILRPRAIVGIKGERFQVTGALDIVFAHPSLRTSVTLASASQLPAATSQVYGLYLPKALPAVLNDMAYRAGFYGFRRAGKDIPAFQGLLANKVTQMLVWPQLSLYTAKSTFFFDIAPALKPGISELANGKSGIVRGNLAGRVDVLTWAPRVEEPRVANDYVKMIRFASDVNAGFELGVERAEKGSHLKVNFPEPILSLQANWESDYQPFLRYSQVAVDTLRDNISSALKKDGFKLFLPQLSLTSQLALRLSTIQVQGEWLSFGFTDKEH